MDQPETPLNELIVSRIEDIGRMRAGLDCIINNELFENLSKHSDYWHSEHTEEDEKLDEIRRKLSCLSDDIMTIINIADRDM